MIAGASVVVAITMVIAAVVFGLVGFIRLLRVVGFLKFLRFLGLLRFLFVFVVFLRRGRFMVAPVVVIFISRAIVGAARNAA